MLKRVTANNPMRDDGVEGASFSVSGKNCHCPNKPYKQVTDVANALSVGFEDICNAIFCSYSSMCMRAEAVHELVSGIRGCRKQMFGGGKTPPTSQEKVVL